MRTNVLGLIALATPLAPTLAAPASSATQAPAIHVDPAAVAAANRLLDAMHYEQLLDRTYEAMIAEAERSLPERLEAAAREPLPSDLKAKLVAAIADTMRRTARDNRADVRKGTVLIYARHFTVAEIDHMAGMMRDPVMVKMQAEMPQIMAEALALSQAGVQRAMPRMIEQLKTIIEDYSRSKGDKPS